MDNVSAGLRAMQVAPELNIEVLALPKGVLKIVQIVLCLIAFAVVAAFDDGYTFEKECLDKANNTTVERTVHFGYPFHLSHIQVDTPLCVGSGNENTTTVRVDAESCSSTPKFFVFTGVICFLYAIVVLAAYVFITPTMEANDGLGYKIDVIVHVVLCIFWFCGSFAMIRAKNQIEKWTEPSRLLDKIKPECDDDQCKVTDDPEYRALGFAIGMGFVNLFAWTSNIYFILKDTPWFDLLFGRFTDSLGGSGSAQRYGTDPYGTNTGGDNSSSLPPQQQIPTF